MGWIDVPGGRAQIPTTDDEMAAMMAEMVEDSEVGQAVIDIIDAAVESWLELCDGLMEMRIVTWAMPAWVLYMADEHERFILWADGKDEDNG